MASDPIFHHIKFNVKNKGQKAFNLKIEGKNSVKL